MRYIGIDTSTTNTAIVILGENKELLNFVLLRPQGKDIIVRSQIICEAVSTHFKGISNTNCKVGIEGASFGSIGKKDKLVMVMGYVYYHLLLEGFDVILLPPSTIKKQFTGNGRADKAEMTEHVPLDVLKEFKGRYKKTDDLVDAYGICHCL